MSDAITKVWFNHATVQVYREPNVPDVFDDEALVGLCGAFSDSRVLVNFTGMFLQLEVIHPAVRLMRRELSYDLDAGKWVVFNAKLRLQPDYWGRDLGVRSIALQARAAQALGVGHLATFAVGDFSTASNPRKEDRWSGYIVWPKIGFDADIPADMLHRLPAAQAAARRLSDLMASSEGQDWWLRNGSDIAVRFDLASGSVSWRLLERYTSERGIRV